MSDWIEYELPEDLIAQEPPDQRAESRLLLVDRKGGSTRHERFHQIGDHLREGDLLVVNDTRVIPARLRAKRPSGAPAEILLIESLADIAGTWKALLRPGKAGREGRELFLDADDSVRIVASGRDHETFLLRFERDGTPLSSAELIELCDTIGETPLPPYIHRNETQERDRDRYQTVFADRPGAVAAPTAGLHFSTELLAQLEAAGVERCSVTLHVGIDTFKPLSEEQVRTGRLHGERVEIDVESGERILAAKAEGRRVVAVGTTSARALESFAQHRELPYRERTQLFIRPGYEFQLVDALVTNFHLPKSSLLLMVSAFASRETILAAYAEAIAERYRFFSYGDAMLIA